MSDESYIRPAGVAGKFYSSDPKILERELALFLENSFKKEHSAPIKGLLCPHAGYMYSGGVAARAYRQVHEEKYDLVVVIAPSHQEAFSGISVFPGIAYETPLGRMECDQEVAARLAWDPHINLSLQGHSGEEHSLEVQLPFLHEVLPEGYKIVPISMGEQNYQMARRLAHTLHEALTGRSVLVVASSDLSHFYPDEEARAKDKIVEDSVAAYDIMGLSEKIESKEAQMCGFGPALAMMIYSRLAGATKSEVLLYRNSSDVTGDRSQVVGYLSAMVY